MEFDAKDILIINLDEAMLIHDMNEDQIINDALFALYRATISRKTKLNKSKLITQKERERLLKIDNEEIFFTNPNTYNLKEIEFISEIEYKIRLSYDFTEGFEQTALMHIKGKKSKFIIDSIDIDNFVKNRK
ncbi:hypothetical protein [Pseudomonas syringae]|uniref:hypothetical protein n=1 Tax=Pseudomonas syringae TaxID=317 RepID=UPI000A1EEFAD|nr:hypothetical protein [Pseudomonas syringae]OSO49007.1 hypothetical protein BV364_00017 [Pseudomonas syringae pv. actinidiae]